MTLDPKGVVAILCTSGLIAVLVWVVLLTGACKTGAY